MRILILAALVLVPIAAFLAAGLSVARGRRRVRADADAAVWQVGHFSTAGVTHVVVRLETPSGRQVLEQREIGTVPDTDPDYDRAFLSLISTAEERAALLRSLS